MADGFNQRQLDAERIRRNFDIALGDEAGIAYRTRLDTQLDEQGRAIHNRPYEYSAEELQAAMDMSNTANPIRFGLFDAVLNATENPRMATSLTQGAEYTPGLGTAMSLKDAEIAARDIPDSYREGDYVDLAGNVGQAGLGLLEAAATVAPFGKQLVRGGRQLARNLNQPGPVPTMYSNPLWQNAADVGQPLPAPRNDAEVMARDILDMRAAGRAGDVTDEMMAQADPQYMFANTPLPMDEASRMARAQEMGFDAGKIRYHGSGMDVPFLDPDMGVGERYQTGVFSTDNPDVADSYVTKSDGMIYPIITRRNDGGAFVDASGVNWNAIPAASPAKVSNSALEQEFPELFADADITAYDVAPSLYDDLFGRGSSTNALARQRRFEGDSNITFENLVDRGPAIKRYADETVEMQRARELSASQPSEVRVDFYGNQIRSPFARFDPEFRHLRNLSAGIAGGGLLATQDDQQQREDEIRQYLGGLL